MRIAEVLRERRMLDYALAAERVTRRRWHAATQPLYIKPAVPHFSFSFRYPGHLLAMRYSELYIS